MKLGKAQRRDKKIYKNKIKTISKKNKNTKIIEPEDRFRNE
jgi:hypothetical protein